VYRPPNCGDLPTLLTRDAGAFAVAVCTSLPRERLEGHADAVVGALADVDVRALAAAAEAAHAARLAAGRAAA
jgi:hypothetical protein